jgi:hypothetical protein
VGSAGDTIDFVLSPKRDLTAARLFLHLALTGTSGIRPRVIDEDGHPAYGHMAVVSQRLDTMGPAQIGGYFADPQNYVGRRQICRTPNSCYGQGCGSDGEKLAAIH